MKYTVTYTNDGQFRNADVVARILDEVAEMREEGVDVEFRGATQEVDDRGRLIEVTARYGAPNKGILGWLNYRGQFPAAGAPRREVGDRGRTGDPENRRCDR